jgi:hypothetical protein
MLVPFWMQVFLWSTKMISNCAPSGSGIVVEVLAPLTRTELSRMGQLEETICVSIQSFIEVGAALKEIRDARLYRASHDTFEAYCKERWALTRQSVNLTISASCIVKNLATIVSKLPTAESQCRPLASLEAEQQQAAWVAAVEKAGDLPVTAKIVSAAVAELFPKQEPKSVSSDEGDSEPSPSMTWPEALKSASRKKQITSVEVAEMLGVALPDVRKSLSVMDKAFGYQVHRLNNEGLFSVTKAPTDQDAIVDTFETLSPKEKMALLRRLNADSDVMRIKSEKQKREMSNGYQESAIEGASNFITQAANELHKYQTNFGADFRWLPGAMRTTEGVAEVVSMIGRLDRIAIDSVAYRKTLNERTKDV